MKRFARIRWGTLIVAMGASAVARGEQKFGVAGCGLGSLIFKPDGLQLSAATTNAVGIQASGITSGTSNCTPAAGPGKKEKSASRQQQEIFVSTNLATLEKDVAQGQGNTVIALSEILGCEKAHNQDFAGFLQTNYAAIFTSVGSVGVLNKIVTSLAQKPEWSGVCSQLELDQEGV